MADSKLSGLPAATVPHAEDLIFITATPSSNPTSKSLSIGTLFGAVPGPVTITGGLTASANSAVTGVFTATTVKSTGNYINIATSRTPASAAGASGDKAGDITWDSSYVYVCVANYTDGLSPIWKRSAITTW